MDNNSKVVVYETAGKNGYDASCLNNIGIQRLSHDIGENKGVIKDAEANIRYAVKDAEADIRHDVLFEGQENQKTVLEVEARLKDRLTIDRNASDAQFLALTDKICATKEETIKMGYEARIEALKNTDRITDKIAHSLEEIREDLCECCKDQAVNATMQTGLLNQIIKGLLK